MKHPVRSGLQVLRRAHDFLASGEVTAAHGPITKHVEALGDINDRLSGHMLTQDDAGRAYRGSTREAKQLASTLRIELMRPVARAAKSLFPDEQMLKGALAMPRTRDYERLIAAAYGIAQQASEHKEQFIAAGFEADFVDRLKKGADALRVALDDRNSNLGRRSAATAGMDQELGRGRDQLRILHDMVAPRLRGDAARRAEWATLSRFATPSRTKASDVPGTATPNAPSIATPTGVTAGAPNNVTQTVPSDTSPDPTTESMPKAA